MGSKKKPKKNKFVQPPLFTPDEEAAITAIIQASDRTDPAELIERVPDSRHALAVIDRVCRDKNPSIPLLVALKAGFKDKQVQKEIKRALFKLRHSGIPVEDFLIRESAPPPILKPPQQAEPAAYVGPILNMSGSRAVLITHEREIKGRHMAMGLVSDGQGIHEFLYGIFSKKRSNEMKDNLSEKTGPLVETSLSHAATILENAYQIHLKNHPDVPPDYLELRPWMLEVAPLLDRPVIYNHIFEDQVERNILTDSQMEKLFQHKLMGVWQIHFDRLKPFVEELMNADHSPIVLTEDQKSDQARRIKEKCMAELFPASECTLVKRRLEEMAFVFFKLEEKDFDRLCLAAAQSIEPQNSVPQKNSVIEFLLKRSLDYYMNLIRGGASRDKQPVESSAPSIIIP